MAYKINNAKSENENCWRVIDNVCALVSMRYAKGR